MQTTDIKTRKLLTVHGFHPRSGTQRLYTKQKKEGRRLVSIRATIQDERTKTQNASRRWPHWMERSVKASDDWTREEPSLEKKSLHGTYHQRISDVADMEKDSAEAPVMAA